jgi:hypothetical protein
MGRTANYVLSLLDQLLGPGEREKRFAWAVGDQSPKTKRAARLPFDAVWEDRRLIVEIDEDQHREVTTYFDKPDRLTVSGVHRGQQRRIYDQRKRAGALANGYVVVAIAWSRKRKAGPADLEEVRGILLDAGIEVARRG